MNQRVLEAIEAISPKDQWLIEYYLKALARTGEPFMTAFQVVKEHRALAMTRNPERYRGRALYREAWQRRLPYGQRGRPALPRKRERMLVQEVRALRRKGYSVTDACQKLSAQWNRAPLTLKNRFYLASNEKRK